jgi:hypothetical protein
LQITNKKTQGENLKTLDILKRFLPFALLFLGLSLFGAAGDATTILKETTTEQVSGEIGWLFIIGGIILGAIVLIVQKNVVLPIIILIGSIVFAMSPDLADGVIQQFGSGTAAP